MLKLDKLVLQTQAITEAVKNRKGLLKLAKALKVKTAGRSDRDLKIDIIKTRSKDFDPAGKSETYIEERFKIALEKLQGRVRKDEVKARAVYYEGSNENSPRSIFIAQTQAAGRGNGAGSVTITDRRVVLTKDKYDEKFKFKLIEESRKAPVN